MTHQTLLEPATPTAVVSGQPHQHQREPGAPPIKDPGEGAAAAAISTAVPSGDRGHARSRRPQQHMGVGTGPRNVAELRRAFRRLEPEKMFRAPRVEGEPIWAYWGRGGGGRGEGADHGHGQGQPPLPPGKRASTKDGFVLVPAKELEELRALEGALRKERGILKAHCLLALKEGEVRVHVRACVRMFPSVLCVCSGLCFDMSRGPTSLTNEVKSRRFAGENPQHVIYWQRQRCGWCTWPERHPHDATVSSVRRHSKSDLVTERRSINRVLYQVCNAAMGTRPPVSPLGKVAFFFMHCLQLNVTMHSQQEP